MLHTVGCKQYDLPIPTARVLATSMRSRMEASIAGSGSLTGRRGIASRQEGGTGMVSRATTVTPPGHQSGYKTKPPCVCLGTHGRTAKVRGLSETLRTRAIHGEGVRSRQWMLAVDCFTHRWWASNSKDVGRRSAVWTVLS